MNIYNTLQTLDLWKSWEQFYEGNEWIKPSSPVPPPKIWEQLLYESKHFTPDTWVSWVEDPHLSTFIPSSIRFIFTQPEWIAQCQASPRFRQYCDNASTVYAYSYGFAHLKNNPKAFDLIYAMVYEYSARTALIPFYENEMINAIDHYENKYSIEETEFPYWHDQQPIQHLYKDKNTSHLRGLVKMMPYVIVKSHYNALTAIKDFLHHHHNYFLEHSSPMALTIILRQFTSTDINDFFKEATTRYPHLLDDPFLIAFIARFPEYETYLDTHLITCLTASNNTLTKCLRDSYSSIRQQLLHRHQQQQPLFSDAFMKASLTHKQVAEYGAFILKDLKLITCSPKTQTKKWLTYCEQHFSLPKNSLIQQYTLMNCIDPERWQFEDQTTIVPECNVLF